MIPANGDTIAWLIFLIVAIPYTVLWSIVIVQFYNWFVRNG